MNTSAVSVGSGVISKIPQLISLKNYSKIFVITDPVVDKLHFKKVKQATSQEVIKILIPKGEAAKNIRVIEKIWQKLFSSGCERKSLIINLGGGATLDAGGFTASTYMRGVPFLQIPTTLVSQVDAAVGGKTAINFAGVKNLIGVFNQPLSVICDIDLLASLPQREFIAGFAEVIKHGLIADQNYFDFITSKNPQDFTKEELVKIVSGSIKIKTKIVGEDEKERGIRRLLNFGHTIGHAIEALSQENKNPLLHGEAVSIGIALEAKISRQVGLMSKAQVDEIMQALSNAGLPIDFPGFSTKQVLEKIKFDKKSEGGEVNWTLIAGIGKGVINQHVSEETVTKLL